MMVGQRTLAGRAKMARRERRSASRPKEFNAALIGQRGPCSVKGGRVHVRANRFRLISMGRGFVLYSLLMAHDEISGKLSGHTSQAKIG